MKIKTSKTFKIIALLLCLSMLLQQTGFAQVANVELNLASRFASFNNALTVEKFRPLHLRYLQYDTKLNDFKLLLDKGTTKDLSKTVIEESSKILLNYFLIGISLPNDSFWVNLRPDSPDNVIDPFLAQTDIGKILLEADVQLKKDTASFTSPETLEGKEYWNKLYKKAEELYGSQNVTIPTLTRPWIVPNEIILRESSDNAYIYKATLKVMLEEDYLKDSATYNFTDARQKQLNSYASGLIREKIIPRLTKEVNTAKRYAPLRQVYYSLILAQWFKQRFANQSGPYIDLINKKNLSNLTSKTTWDKNIYFQQYQKSFKDGEYNLKVPVSTPTGQVVRSYFSGGLQLGGMAKVMETIKAGVLNEDGFLSLNLRKNKLEKVTVINGRVEVDTNTAVIESAQPSSAKVEDYLGAPIASTKIRISVDQFHADGSVDFDLYIAFHKAFASMVSTDSIPESLRVFGQTPYDCYTYWMEHGIDLKAASLVLGKEFEDPRRNIEANRQAGDARKQTVFEAIANSIDAIVPGSQIGQFGMGIKQSEMWLFSDQDSVSVKATADGKNIYNLEIKKNANGKIFISTQKIISKQAQPKGVEFKIKSSQISKERKEEIIKEAALRYAYATGVKILLNGELINNDSEDVYLLGEKEYDQSLGEINVEISGNTIIIRDTGKGMDARTSARMLVAGLGSKEFTGLNDEEAQEAMKKIKVIHKPNGQNAVFFLRNGEAVAIYSLPEGMANIYPGGIGIEMGKLISVGYGRANILMDERWQQGVLYILRTVLADDRSAEEKIVFINTILATVDALKAIFSKETDQEATGSTESEVRLNEIYIEAAKLAKPLIDQLSKAGMIFIPNAAGELLTPTEKQWTRIKIPEVLKARVVYAHESLINWRSNDWLKQIGAKQVPVSLTVEKEPVQLWSVPFQNNDNKSIEGYRVDWDSDPHRIPVFYDQSGRVIVDSRLLARFEELLSLTQPTVAQDEELLVHRALLEIALSRHYAQTDYESSMDSRSFVDIQFEDVNAAGAGELGELGLDRTDQTIASAFLNPQEAYDCIPLENAKILAQGKAANVQLEVHGYVLVPATDSAENAAVIKESNKIFKNLRYIDIQNNSNNSGRFILIDLEAGDAVLDLDTGKMQPIEIPEELKTKNVQEMYSKIVADVRHIQFKVLEKDAWYDLWQDLRTGEIIFPLQKRNSRYQQLQSTDNYILDYKVGRIYSFPLRRYLINLPRFSRRLRYPSIGSLPGHKTYKELSYEFLGAERSIVFDSQTLKIIPKSDPVRQKIRQAERARVEELNKSYKKLERIGRRQGVKKYDLNTPIFKDGLGGVVVNHSSENSLDGRVIAVDLKSGTEIFQDTLSWEELEMIIAPDGQQYFAYVNKEGEIVFRNRSGVVVWQFAADHGLKIPHFSKMHGGEKNVLLKFGTKEKDYLLDFMRRRVLTFPRVRGSHIDFEFIEGHPVVLDQNRVIDVQTGKTILVVPEGLALRYNHLAQTLYTIDPVTQEEVFYQFKPQVNPVQQIPVEYRKTLIESATGIRALLMQLNNDGLLGGNKYDLLRKLLEMQEEQIVTSGPVALNKTVLAKLQSALDPATISLLQANIQQYVRILSLFLNSQEAEKQIRASLQRMFNNFIQLSGSAPQALGQLLARPDTYLRLIELLAVIDDASLLSQGANLEELLEVITQLNRGEVTNPLRRRQALRYAVAYLKRSQRPDQNAFLAQIKKLSALQKSGTGTSPFTKILEELAGNNQNAIEAFIQGQPVDLPQQCVGYVTFLTQESDLLAHKSVPQYLGRELLTQERKINLATVVDLYRKGMTSFEGIIAYVQSQSKITISTEIAQEILKEMIAQANETGVVARELAQNAADAIVREISSGQDQAVASVPLAEGRIILRNYFSNGEYVEEIEDNGIGIQDDLSMLVPRLSGIEKRTGSASSEGYFGSGKYTMYNGVDRVEVIRNNGKNRLVYVIAPIRENGKVVGEEIISVKALDAADVRLVNHTGTIIKRIKSLDGTYIPELNSSITRSSYIVFAGMVSGRTVKDAAGNEVPINIYFETPDGALERVAVKHEVLLEEDLRFEAYDAKAQPVQGKLRLISSSDIPRQVITSNGLRLTPFSLLISENNPYSKYAKYIPTQLFERAKELNLIIQLPKFDLTKDRSSIADADVYDDLLARQIALMVMKVIVKKALINHEYRFRGFPEDWWSETAYNIISLDSRTESMARRANRGEILKAKDFALLAETLGGIDRSSKLAEFMVALKVEMLQEGSRKTTSLLHEKAKLYPKAFGFGKAADAFLQDQVESIRSNIFNLLLTPVLTLTLPLQLVYAGIEKLLSMGDINLSSQDSQTFMAIANRFGKIFKSLLIAPVKVGFFAGAYIPALHILLINTGASDTSDVSVNEMVKVVVHELGHYLEKIKHGIPQTIFTKKFSHSGDGPWSDGFKQAATYILYDLNLHPGLLAKGEDLKNVKTVLREAQEQLAKNPELGTQVGNMKYYNRLVRALKVLKKFLPKGEAQDLNKISKTASVAEIMAYMINYLHRKGLVPWGEEIDNDGNQIIRIRDDGYNQLDRGAKIFFKVLKKLVLNPEDGVSAVNFQDKSGQWWIVGFDSELENLEILEHEQSEINFLKAGDTFEVAHLKAGGQLKHKNTQLTQKDVLPAVNQEVVQEKAEELKGIIFSAATVAAKKAALTELINSTVVDRRSVVDVLGEVIRANAPQISIAFKRYVLKILSEMMDADRRSVEIAPAIVKQNRMVAVICVTVLADYLGQLVVSEGVDADLKDEVVKFLNLTVLNDDNQPAAEALAKIVQNKEAKISWKQSILEAFRDPIYKNRPAAIIAMIGAIEYLKNTILETTADNISFAQNAINTLQALSAMNNQKAVLALKEIVSSPGVSVILRQEAISALMFAADKYNSKTAGQALRDLREILKDILRSKNFEDEIKLEAISALGTTLEDVGFWSGFIQELGIIDAVEIPMVKQNLEECLNIISHDSLLATGKDAVADFLLELLKHKKDSKINNDFSLLLETVTGVAEYFNVQGFYGDNVGFIVTALIAKDNWLDYAAQFSILVKELQKIKPSIAPTTSAQQQETKAAQLMTISSLLYYLLNLSIDVDMIKVVTKFLISDNRQIVFEAKLNLIMSNRWLLEEAEILDYLSSRYDKLPSESRLNWIRSIGNIIHVDAMNSEDTLADWDIFFNDYLPKFGFLASRALILIDRDFYQHQEILSPELIGYNLADLGVRNINDLAKYVRRIKTKLFKNRDIYEKDLEHPIYYEIISGLLGFNKGAWGGAFQGLDLMQIVQTVHQYVRENKLPPYLLTSLEQVPDGFFPMNRISDEINFTAEANKIFKTYQALVSEALELIGKHNKDRNLLVAILKSRILETLNELIEQTKDRSVQLNLRAGEYYDNLVKIAETRNINLELILANASADLNKRLPNLEQASDAVSNSGTNLELILALVNNLKGKDLEAQQNIVTLALLIEAFSYSSSMGNSLLRVASPGKVLSVEFINQLATFKNDFLDKHVLAKENIKDLALLGKLEASRKEILHHFKTPSFNLQSTGEKMKAQKKKADAPTQIKAFFDTRIFLAVSGSIGDACTTKLGLDIFQHPALIGAVIFAQGVGVKEELVGSGLILKNQIMVNGLWENAWILRATNPSEDLVSAYEAGDFLQGYIKYVQHLAQVYNQEHPEALVKHILMPIENEHALSNREAVKISSRDLTADKEIVQLRLSDNFNEHEIQFSCKAVAAVAPVSLSREPELLSAPNPKNQEQLTGKPIASVDALGGINFNNLQMIKQSAGFMGAAGINPGMLNAGNFVPDKEWQEIERVLNAGIIPSLERIKEYLIYSCQDKDCQIKIGLALGGIAEILRMEEESPEVTNSGLKRILALIESSQSAQQLGAALAKI